jgi:hypothetical protein
MPIPPEPIPEVPPPAPAPPEHMPDVPREDPIPPAIQPDQTPPNAPPGPIVAVISSLS